MQMNGHWGGMKLGLSCLIRLEAMGGSRRCCTLLHILGHHQEHVSWMVKVENKMHNGFNMVYQLLKHDEGKFTFKVGIFAEMPLSVTPNHTDHIKC